MITPTALPQEAHDPTEAIAFLTRLFGDELLRRLQQNPNLHLPYSDEDILPDAWFARAAQTVLSLDDLVSLSNRIRQQSIDQNRNLLQNMERLHWQISEMEQQSTAQLISMQQSQAAYQASLADLQAEVSRLKREADALIRPEELAEEIFGDLPLPLQLLLRETAHQATPDGARWLGRFSKGWTRLQRAVDQAHADEQARLDQVHTALTKLLSDLSGLYVPQRRSILEQVALWASNSFSDYIFISPEESMQVDPAIHNAWGLGSGTIQEGISFAVLRRQSRVAVIYAEVKVKSA